MFFLLLVVLVAVIANLVLGIASWWRHDGLANRVTRLEANQANSLNAVECRLIFERLSSLDGRMVTTTQLMQTIQNHLLEREE